MATFKPTLGLRMRSILAVSRRTVGHFSGVCSRRSLVPVTLVMVLGFLAFVDPVAAAPPSSTNPICSAAKLPGIIEGFFQLTTAIGIMGLVLVWQVDTVIEMFRPAPEQREAVRRHKRTAAKSAGIVTVLGPLYTVAGSIMGLPLATCVNLAPW